MGTKGREPGLRRKTPGMREAAQAFVDFLVSPEAQRAFSEYGLRPVDPEVAREVASKFPPVEDLWTIDDLGGWDRVLKDIYGPDGAWPRVFAEKSRPR